MKRKCDFGWLPAVSFLALLSCAGSGGPQTGSTSGSGGTLAAGFPGSGGLGAAGPAPETLPLLNTPPAGVDAKLWQALMDALARELARCKGASVARAAVPAFGSAALRGGGWRTGPSAPLKTSSAPPSGTGAVVGDLAITANEDGSADFAWSFRSPGDYDQNGEVNLADLTPVGIGYGKTSSAGDWAKHEPADGDGNGEINLADVTPIGANFGNTLDGYELQHSATPATEASWQATGAEAALSSATTPAGGGRKTFSLAIPAGDPSLVDGEYFRVRSYIGSGAGRQYGQAGISVQFHGGEPPPPENQPPIAVLTVEPQSGLAPLDVLLDATGSGDIDGSIVKYEFDADGPLNGEEWTDIGPAGVMEFSYLGNGDFLCALRVTDDLGATDTDVALVKSRSANPPSAALTAALLSGPCPLHVVWDASTSADSDGIIVSYEWDFDADGECEYDSGPVPTADFWYYEPGLYTASVRVTDNDGLSDSGANQAEATDGATWHVQELPMPMGKQSSDTCSLIEVEGKPAIAVPLGPLPGSADAEAFIRASDSLATAWEDPVYLEYDIPNDLSPVPDGSGGVLGIVSGRPAYATGKGFWLALDSAGSAWGMPVAAGSGGAKALSLFLMQDHPIITDYGTLRRAADPLGTNWLEPITIDLFTNGRSSGLTIGTRAFVAIDHFQGSIHSLFVVRTQSADGSQWSIPIVVDAGTSTGGDPQLIDAGGRPGIFYYGFSIGAVKFVCSLDESGKEWGSPFVVGPYAQPHVTGGTHGGRPAVVYQDSVSGNLYAVFSNDFYGASWGPPVHIDEYPPGSPSQAGTSYALVSDNPALAYCVPEGGVRYLRYASYY